MFSASAASADPTNHAAFLKNNEYKEAFERYSATLKEAKNRLDAHDLALVMKEVEAAMNSSVKEDLASGTAEVEAWSSAFIIGRENLSRELTWDWLRRNPEGIQGFYRMKSKAFDGWLAVQKGDEPDLYAIQLYAIQKNSPYNSGELDGFGKLKDKTMSAVDKNDDKNPITLIFHGETVTVTEPKAFKESGALGAGVSFDGTFEREKK
ncbi:MAG: hypothetical protein IK079_05945 [Desulfovibrio sp.]|nr:hypothetical protein [Desulfovibrio sp.]